MLNNSISWKVPPIGKLKANVDATVKGCQCDLEIVLGDEFGQVMPSCATLLKPIYLF